MEVDSVDFSAPAAVDGEVETLNFRGEGTTVLAFFPGAFTPTCTEEMCSFRDSLSRFDDLGAEVIGISVDTPFALVEFEEKNNLDFTLVSDTATEIAEQYGVKTELSDLGYAIAKRAVLVVKDGEVVYSEVLDDPHNQPDMERLKQRLQDL